MYVNNVLLIFSFDVLQKICLGQISFQKIISVRIDIIFNGRILFIEHIQSQTTNKGISNKCLCYPFCLFDWNAENKVSR